MDESTFSEGVSEMTAAQNGSSRHNAVSPSPSHLQNGGRQNKVADHASNHQGKPLTQHTSRGSTLHATTLFINFDHEDEKVYKAYFRRQRLGLLPVLVAIATVHAVECIVLDLVPGFTASQLDRIVVFSVVAFFVLIIFVIISICSFSEAIRETMAVAMWCLLALQIFYDTGTAYPRHMPSDRIGWLLILIFVTQMTLPVGAWLSLPIILLLAVIHSVLEGVFWYQEPWTLTDFPVQAAANVLLCLGAACLGFAGSLFLDRLNRRSVLETKSALSAKAKIEVAYKNKERLLLSVLPKHVADEMLKDVGNLADGQFRKIYMSRYENVSILFADIVGFTAISSSVTAAELVKILNELFASFDVLANKFHQVRIKILGDCYYCVCGALEPRQDHAVLSIHMGLSMVEAISSVRQKTGKDVNMRVGVHTGACLGGVLGQRQWQFDVLGKEVGLANKMESGGLPARVHISESTKQCLDGEFELEDGRGWEREEELRLKNINTYLVKGILKPYPEGTLDKHTNGAAMKYMSNGVHKNGKSHRSSSDASAGQVFSANNTDDDDDEEDDDDDEVTNVKRETEQRREMSLNLQRELIEKDKRRALSNKFHFLTYKFKDASLELRYQQRSDSYSGLPLVALCAALLSVFLAKLCILPRTALAIALYLTGVVILIVMAVVSMALTFAKRFPKSLVRFAASIDRQRHLKLLWGVSASIIFFICDTVAVAECNTDSYNISLVQHFDSQDAACHYIVYFAHSGCMVLIAVSSMVIISHMTKGILIFIVTGIHCLIILIFVEELYNNYDILVYRNDGHHPHIKYRLVGQVLAVSLALNFYNSQMEFTSRKLYLWKEESKQEKETAADMQRKNEALVYNLLPAHVAKDFLGRRKKDTELYSHAYDEVAVMFAACPNYHAFYNESAINNNGLECLRFLNEIISDYDELLNLSKFSGIVKIKTVGPTYMAASGMVDAGTKQDCSIKEKWEHLNDLVLFAFALQDVIKKINEQSFNNFILRIGINHGPIIAGVIGARKPHYDIWGNTVNVASRMESTGQAGRIQVVEETRNILQEFGHTFEKRGLIKVKGKGELMTYFLEKRAETGDGDIPNQVPSS